MLIDHVKILVQAGDGGNGCESYMRRSDRKIIPHGGDGGRGGNVIFRATHNVASLANLRFKQHLVAESGGHGSSNRKRGRNGEDLLVEVPLGTRLLDSKRNLLIRHLTAEGEEVVVVEGGRGGVGNYGGKVATPGEKGASLEVELQFTLQADFFLVGLPNSGKSALMKCLTRSQVKEEDYPFSTKSPQLGVCQISDFEQITLCELPSLYRVSHEGRGMGTDFLRHLQDARRILLVLDPVSQFSSSLMDGLKILRRQIEIFNKEYLDIPYAVIVNKIDLAETHERLRQEDFRPPCPSFFVSAKTHEGIPELINYLKEKKEERSRA